MPTSGRLGPNICPAKLQIIRSYTLPVIHEIVKTTSVNLQKMELYSSSNWLAKKSIMYFNSKDPTGLLKSSNAYNNINISIATCSLQHIPYHNFGRRISRNLLLPDSQPSFHSDILSRTEGTASLKMFAPAYITGATPWPEKGNSLHKDWGAVGTGTFILTAPWDKYYYIQLTKLRLVEVKRRNISYE